MRRDKFSRTTAAGFYKRKNESIMKSQDSIDIIKMDEN